MNRSLAATLWVAICLSSCGGPCSNKSVEAIKSPDGQRTATTFKNDCGASGPEEVYVALNWGGKADFSGEHIIFLTRHNRRLEIIWKSDTHLEVSCRTCIDEDIRTMVVRKQGVTIDYDIPLLNSPVVRSPDAPRK
jgi:hypothetical protein